MVANIQIWIERIPESVRKVFINFPDLCAMLLALQALKATQYFFLIKYSRKHHNLSLWKGQGQTIGLDF